MCFSVNLSWFEEDAQHREEALCPLAHGTAQPWAIAEPLAAPAGILQKVLNIGDKKKEAAAQSRPHATPGTECSNEG